MATIWNHMALPTVDAVFDVETIFERKCTRTAIRFTRATFNTVSCFNEALLEYLARCSFRKLCGV